MSDTGLFQPYPPEEDVPLMANDESAYSTAKQHIDKLIAQGANQRSKVVSLVLSTALHYTTSCYTQHTLSHRWLALFLPDFS